MAISIGAWRIGTGGRPASGASEARGPFSWLTKMLQATPAQRRAQPGTSAALDWWLGLSRSERITALSILGGGIVAIICSVAWAIALSYIAHQNARVALLGDEMYSIEAGEQPEGLSNQEGAAVGGGWRR